MGPGFACAIYNIAIYNPNNLRCEIQRQKADHVGS